jgi:hypothetical protein
VKHTVCKKDVPMNKPSLTVIPFDGEGRQTAMFYSTSIQLGPDGVGSIPNAESKCPYFGFAGVGHGQTTGTHLHDCYSLLMFPEGEYEVGGKTYGPGSVVLIEPRVPTGECAPGPKGVKEIFIYENGYGSIPFFKDLSDQRTVALFESYPGFKDFALSRPRPPENPQAKAHLLDRVKHGKRSIVGTAYTCQIGPAGFGVSPNPSGTHPFVVLTEFNAGATVPKHSHDGWSAIAIIKGSVEVSGTPLAAETSALVKSGTPVSYKIGPSGAQVMQFFDTERAAVRKFEDPIDEATFAL